MVHSKRTLTHIVLEYLVLEFTAFFLNMHRVFVCACERFREHAQLPMGMLKLCERSH